MAARHAGYGMKVTEEQQAAKDTQYNQLVAPFVSGHAVSQGSITNLTATNTMQQQQVVALNNYHGTVAYMRDEKVPYCSPVVLHIPLAIACRSSIAACCWSGLIIEPAGESR